MKSQVKLSKDIYQESINIDFKDQKLLMLERRIYDLKNLIGLGISLSSNLDFENLVESILYTCIGQMVVEKVAILLQVDIDSANYYIHLAKGYDTDFKDHGIILKDKTPFLTFLENNPEPHKFSDLKSIAELSSDLHIMQDLSPHLIVPMKSKNSLNGMIILGDKLHGDDFTIVEKEFLEDLAKFAAIAVENSRLYLMATLDRMTRLYIHHYFQERLTEEINRSIRNNTSLSLIISDIDFFKKFNDSYGHQQGDSILKEIAQIFKQNLRSVDIAARYGGEEFAIILPETNLEDAKLIAERLRKKVDAFQFPGQDAMLHVTISLGVAQFDQTRDKSKKDLIKRADSYLYKAKENGRNMIVAADLTSLNPS